MVGVGSRPKPKTVSSNEPDASVTFRMHTKQKTHKVQVSKTATVNPLSTFFLCGLGFPKKGL